MDRRAFGSRPSFALTVVVSLALAAAAPIPAAHASAPVGPTAVTALTLDGSPLAVPPRAGRSLAPTLHFDTATQTYHLWVLLADAPGESMLNMRHATAADGKAFTSAGTLTYAGTPFAGTPWGTTVGEPAMIYPKFAVLYGRYKLLTWTYNNATFPSPWGDYNYAISVDDIGTSLANTVLTHEGPIGPVGAAGSLPGQTAGAWGVVNDVLYYENNFFLGRAATPAELLPVTTPFAPPATVFTGPWRVTAIGAAVKDLVHTLPLPTPKNCFDAGPPTFYVHNDARVLANGDGTLGLFYAIRDCATGARVNKQLYYAESADDGLTWSDPVGIFADGNAVTVNGLLNTGNFSLADVVVVNGQRVVYFSTTDAAGNLVVAAAPPAPKVAGAVPADAGWALVVTALLIAAAALAASRRRELSR